jgi:hypothetical protein
MIYVDETCAINQTAGCVSFIPGAKIPQPSYDIYDFSAENFLGIDVTDVPYQIRAEVALQEQTPNY